MTNEHQNKIIQEYADAGRMFADIISEEGCNSTTFIMFKLLTDIAEALKNIENNIDLIVRNGIGTHNK